jgi:hypothetical protein
LQVTWSQKPEIEKEIFFFFTVEQVLLTPQKPCEHQLISPSLSFIFYMLFKLGIADIVNVSKRKLKFEFELV